MSADLLTAATRVRTDNCLRHVITSLAWLQPVYDTTFWKQYCHQKKCFCLKGSSAHFIDLMRVERVVSDTLKDLHLIRRDDSVEKMTYRSLERWSDTALPHQVIEHTSTSRGFSLLTSATASYWQFERDLPR